jgi:hypothetical protein
MPTPLANRDPFGPTLRRTLGGLKAVADANGMPDDGGRYLDVVGGLVKLGHQHGHPGCADYRAAALAEQASPLSPNPSHACGRGDGPRPVGWSEPANSNTMRV